MKKSVKLLMLGLLAVGTLAGCNTNKKTSSDASSAAPASESSSKSSENPSSSEAPSSSEESSSSSSSEPEPPQPTRDWTEAEKELMEEHLHGIILPFFDVEGIALDYDDATEKFSIAGLAIEDGQIAEYAQLYDAAEGWNDVSNQYSAWSSAPAGSFFVFERFVQTEEGKRGISVQFFGSDGSSYSTSGPFYLYASDPFCYEFPDLAAEYSKYSIEGPNIPEPETADLYYEFYPDSYNDWYYEKGYEEYMNATIYIYGLNEEAFMAYGLQCELAGWTITEGEDEGEYNAVFVNADEGTQYTASIFYSEDYVALSFNYVATELPITSWPTAKIEEAFQEHEKTSFSIPEFNGDGYEYEFYDNFSYGYIGIYVSYADADDLAVYAATLTEAGWDVVETDGVYEARLTTADGIARIDFEYKDNYEQDYFKIFYDLEALPTAEWPAEAVAEMLGEEITDVLPAFDADYLPPESYFQPFNDSYGMGVMVYLPEEETDIATYLEMYAGILTSGDNPFVYDGSKFYVSPNEQFYVYLYEGTENNLVIELSLPKEKSALPLDTLATVFAQLGWNLELEPFAIESDYSWSIYNSNADELGGYLQIYVAISSTSIGDAAEVEYQNILLEAGWKNYGVNDYGEPIMLDPSESFTAELTWGYDNSYNVYFMINISNLNAPEVDHTVWPTDKIATLLQGLDETISDVLPACENGSNYSAQYADASDTYSDVKISVTPADGYTASQLQTAFNAALVEAGFHDMGDDGFGNICYDSPNHEYNVCAWVSSNGSLIIDILINE